MPSAGSGVEGQRVVVTGGAGYVGSVVAHHLARVGARVTTLDNLAGGHREAIGALPWIEADVRDARAVESALRDAGATAVCHLAAMATVPESFALPALYEEVNVGGTHAVIEAMRRTGVRRIVFASTCGIYGPSPAADGLLREDDPAAPASPYAETKLGAERALLEADAAGTIDALCLRFFNAAGADREAGVGERHDPESHAIPLLLRWALHGDPFAVFGTDYPTRDGTCERDYVHVRDLGMLHAHALAPRAAPVRGVLNAGSGHGTTVRELVDAVRAVTETAKHPTERPRRDGDAASLVADLSRARDALGWNPAFGLRAMIEDALWFNSRGPRREAPR